MRKEDFEEMIERCETERLKKQEKFRAALDKINSDESVLKTLPLLFGIDEEIKTTG